MNDRYIFRRTLTEKYTVVTNDLIRDTRLTWEARGLLIYLLSQKPDWTVRKTDLERQSEANDFVVSRILKELEDLRYIYREKIQDENGRFQWVTFVFDTPIPHSSMDGKPGDIVSTDIESTTTGEIKKGDLMDAMLAYQGDKDDLEDYPVDVKAHLEAFVREFKRAPAKAEKASWIKEARKWLSMGVESGDVKKMYRYCRDKGLVVKDLYSITFAFDELRQGGTTAKDKLAKKRYG